MASRRCLQVCTTYDRGRSWLLTICVSFVPQIRIRQLCGRFPVGYCSEHCHWCTSLGLCTCLFAFGRYHTVDISLPLEHFGPFHFLPSCRQTVRIAMAPSVDLETNASYDNRATSSLKMNLTQVDVLGQQWNQPKLSQIVSRLNENTTNANAGRLVGNRMFNDADYMVCFPIVLFARLAPFSQARSTGPPRKWLCD